MFFVIASCSSWFLSDAKFYSFSTKVTMVAKRAQNHSAYFLSESKPEEFFHKGHNIILSVLCYCFVFFVVPFRCKILQFFPNRSKWLRKVHKIILPFSFRIKTRKFLITKRAISHLVFFVIASCSSWFLSDAKFYSFFK